ncbi:MAG: NAD(+) kinase [Deltaproteobacteria bacterium HGW-Deltaproteobacteria-13]|jgi:NAD+ kinase|nr:MAG: NAD(+) kinase [Deltaproteobacteria bacterium HGW-Deltaproteobacteria-13]
MKLKRIGIVANIEKEKMADHVKSLKKWLEEKGLEVFLGTEISQKIALGGGLKWNDLARKSQLVVALGGDGTMLRTARYVAEYKVPILGINMGGLGYLTEVNLNEMHSTLELVIQGKFTAEKRMMLNVSLKHGKTVTNVGDVLNDVVINRGSLSRMNELEMEVNGKYLTTYKGDGLIVSTPTGSTAYSLSAGGPIVFPGKDLIIINPICPHTLTNRPIIFSEDSNLKITLWSKDNGAVLTLDGQETYRMTSGDVVTVKKSKQVTMLIISPYRSHAEILRSKLGWGDLPPGAKKKKNA